MVIVDAGRVAPISIFVRRRLITFRTVSICLRIVEITLGRELALGNKNSLHAAREGAERETLLKVLDETGWNVSQAARSLGLERTNLHKRMKALQLSRRN